MIVVRILSILLIVIFISSGVSAEIDMALVFVSDLLGKEIAEEITFRIEYNWQSDKLHDDFWKQ